MGKVTEDEDRDLSDRVARAVTFALEASGRGHMMFAVLLTDDGRDVRVVGNFCRGCMGGLLARVGPDMAGPCTRGCEDGETPGA